MPQVGPQQKKLESRLKMFAAAAGTAVAMTGAFFLYGWLTGAMTYRGFQVITIKTNASLCQLLCGLSLLLSVLASHRRTYRLIAQLFALLSLTIGGLTVIEHVTGVDFGIDQLLASEPPGAIGFLHPNRMGPPGAVSFTLGGAALLLLSKRPKAAQWLAISICLIALLGMIGYLYGVRGLYGAARFTVVAWQMTISNFLLGIGILFARPHQGIMAPITAPGPGRDAVQRLMPYALVLPVFLGWLRLQGELHGLFETSFGTSLLVLAWVVIFSALVYRTGQKLAGATRAERAALAERQRTQSLLLEAEALSHTGAWEWDVAARLWTFSDEWLRIHGAAVKTLTPEALLAIAHPDDRAAVQAAFEAVRTGERAYEIEHRIIRQDTGETRVVRACGQFMKDDDGHVVRVYGFVQDITEQKQAKDESHVQRQLLESVTENMPAGVFLARGDDLRIVLINPQYQALAPGKEMIGKTVEEVWPEIQPWFGDIMRRVATTGDAHHALDQRILLARSHDAPLEERYFTWSTVRVPLPENEGWGVLTTAWETTERKRSEEALRESEAKFRAVFELAAVGMGRAGFEDARWIDVNAAFCRMLGYTPEFMRATPWPEITHPDDVDLDLVPFRRMAAGEQESYTVEKRFIHREGHHVWARLTLSLVRDAGGQPLYEIAVIEDITARKRAEEELRRTRDELEIRVRERTAELSRALEDLRVETAERLQAVEELRRKEHLLMQQGRLAAMGEMLVNISHQWRQPLNVVGLILQELKRSQERGKLTTEALSTGVARARDLIFHMSQTIDDFHDYLKPERLKAEFDLSEVVQKAVAMVDETLKGVAVEHRTGEEGIVPVQGYRNEFIQAVINLLINARDALREHKTVNPEIRIRTFREQGKSVVTIADNAGGIPEEIIDRIFDPYFTTKAPDKGTGIGLFMAQTIIEKNMGGRLTVRNTGEGAEFRIEI